MADFSVTYHCDAIEPSGAYYDPARLPDLTWWEIDTLICEGCVKVRFDSKNMHSMTWVAAMSADFVFALRNMIFYGSTSEDVINRDNPDVFKFQRNLTDLRVSFLEGFDASDPIELGQCKIGNFAEEVGRAHTLLLMQIFEALPELLTNASFMDGYPDARLVAQRHGLIER